MTNLQNNDSAHATNLQAIDQAELAQIEGGGAALLFIAACFVAGVAVGYYATK